MKSFEVIPRCRVCWLLTNQLIASPGFAFKWGKLLHPNFHSPRRGEVHIHDRSMWKHTCQFPFSQRSTLKGYLGARALQEFTWSKWHQHLIQIHRLSTDRCYQKHSSINLLRKFPFQSLFPRKTDLLHLSCASRLGSWKNLLIQESWAGNL